MLLLVTKSPTTLDKYPHRNVGVLYQPRYLGRIEDAARKGYLWAADNDAYSDFDEDRYVAMLDRLTGLPGGLFVTLPDVVGDAEATFNLFLRWYGTVGRTRQPIGFVLQDGAEEIPWNAIDALFIGGSTEYKLGPEAAQHIKEAKSRGKWVHMGRVNSLKRIAYAKELECDSIDGSSLSMFTDTYLPKFAEAAL